MLNKPSPSSSLCSLNARQFTMVYFCSAATAIIIIIIVIVVVVVVGLGHLPRGFVVLLYFQRMIYIWDMSHSTATMGQYTGHERGVYKAAIWMLHPPQRPPDIWSNPQEHPRLMRQDKHKMETWDESMTRKHNMEM